LGYVSATTGIGGLFVEMATQRLGELLPPLLRRYAQRPDLALRSVQTALYPLFVHQSDNVPAAELLSIMVEPAARSQGVGGLLMAAFLQTCRNRGLEAVTVTVDAANDGAQRFYARHGFTPWRDITLYGRAMRVYRRRL
jgi:ribosomal protein S18 acetylase RimI-like enzyme